MSPVVFNLLLAFVGLILVVGVPALLALSQFPDMLGGRPSRVLDTWAGEVVTVWV